MSDPYISDEETYVTKRNGSREPISFDKITTRLRKLKIDVEASQTKFTGKLFKLHVNVTDISKLVVNGIYPNIQTSELDEYAADVCYVIKKHPHYAYFGGCILISNIESNIAVSSGSNTPFSVKEYAEKAYNHIHERTLQHSPLISKKLYDIFMEHHELIDSRMDVSRNLLYDYFSMRTQIDGKYLLREWKKAVRKKI